MAKALQVYWGKSEDGTSLLFGGFAKPDNPNCVVLGSVRPQGERFRVMLQQSIDPAHYCLQDSEEKGKLLVELHHGIIEL